MSNEKHARERHDLVLLIRMAHKNMMRHGHAAEDSYKRPDQNHAHHCRMFHEYQDKLSKHQRALAKLDAIAGAE